MQNPEQKINSKLGLIIFLVIISFVIVVGGLPGLLFVALWAISFVPKIKKLLKKNGYSISDIFSKDGGMIITLILENLKKEKQKTQNNLHKTNDDIILDDDETINELGIDELEESDESFNYKNNNFKALDNNGYRLTSSYNYTLDVWKIIKMIMIGFVIVAALPIFVFLPERIDLFNIDIARSKEILENIFLSSSLISRIVLAIIAVFIIFKISRDYYKNNFKS